MPVPKAAVEHGLRQAGTGLHQGFQAALLAQESQRGFDVGLANDRESTVLSAFHPFFADPAAAVKEHQPAPTVRMIRDMTHREQRLIGQHGPAAREDRVGSPAQLMGVAKRFGRGESLFAGGGDH